MSVTVGNGVARACMLIDNEIHAHIFLCKMIIYMQIIHNLQLTKLLWLMYTVRTLVMLLVISRRKL